MTKYTTALDPCGTSSSVEGAAPFVAPLPDILGAECLPLRSVLASTRPINTGTPEIEGAPSLLCRMADDHSVFPASLMRTLVFPRVRGKVDGGRYLHLRLLLDPRYIREIERLTMIENLSETTFISFRHVMSLGRLVRRHMAWCPQCYQESRQKGQPVNNKLKWHLRAVTICLQHSVALMSSCPSCESTASPLEGSAAFDYCPKCGTWLGMIPKSIIRCTDKELAEQVWVQKNIDDLLSIRPLLCSASGQRIQFFLSLALRLCGKNIVVLSESRLANFLSKKTLPTFNELLAMSRLFSVSIVDMLRFHPVSLIDQDLRQFDSLMYTIFPEHEDEPGALKGAIKGNKPLDDLGIAFGEMDAIIARLDSTVAKASEYLWEPANSLSVGTNKVMMGYYCG
jgi:predicted RNA-binding Zn-ribbon protein involved in translation (DUF1610 family)